MQSVKGRPITMRVASRTAYGLHPTVKPWSLCTPGIPFSVGLATATRAPAILQSSEPAPPPKYNTILQLHRGGGNKQARKLQPRRRPQRTPTDTHHPPALLDAARHLPLHIQLDYCDTAQPPQLLATAPPAAAATAGWGLRGHAAPSLGLAGVVRGHAARPAGRSSGAWCR